MDYATQIRNKKLFGPGGDKMSRIIELSLKECLVTKILLLEKVYKVRHIIKLFGTYITGNFCWKIN